MTINIVGRKTTIRDNFKERIEKKLKKFDRFFKDRDDAKATVIVTEEGGRETVEVTIVSPGMIFRAEKTSPDRLDSLDAVVETLFRQIVKHKDKLDKKLKSTVFNVEIPDYPDEEIRTIRDEFRVVRTKNFVLKPMDIEEAILQMNMLGHEFFLFQNSATSAANVVYRRKDGDYGLLEPTYQ